MGLACIILAAGLGRRMGGDLAKVLARTSENSLIGHVLETCAKLEPERTIIVVGHKRELVEEEAKRSPFANSLNLSFAVQEEQRGTGHAALSALPQLSGFLGEVLILCGDTPLVSSDTLRGLFRTHEVQKATISLISFICPSANQYGRIVRSKDGTGVAKIVEAKDCSPEELMISEVNAGIYLVDSPFLKPALEQLTDDNVQRELYLTDVVGRAVKEGQRVSALVLQNGDEVLGVNTRADLAAIDRVLNMRRVEKALLSGVNIIAPSSVWIEPGVLIAQGAKIGPNTQLRGETSIHAAAEIEGSSIIIDSVIGERALIKLSCRIDGAVLGPDTSVGPFANLRPGTKLGAHARIGNFVETKNAQLAEGVKAPHLTYLGDCEIGEGSNIGAGTITCNYDGFKKHRTSIGKGVFVGSNSTLVAPIRLEEGSFVAAGSVVTKDVESDSLAFGRSQQVNKAGWALRWRSKNGTTL